MYRRTAVIAGTCYLVTHVTSMAALALYGPVLNHADFVLGAGSTTGVLLGALLEIVLAIAVVGTAVALYPAIRRTSESGALAYAALRTLEAGVILVGVVSLLAVVSLRGHGADSGTLVPIGRALTAVHDWTFLLGPDFICAADTLTLAYVLRRSRLVPAFIPTLGTVGGCLLALSGVAVLFGAYSQVSPVASLAALPVFAWELSLAIYLITKGFRRPAPAIRTTELATV